MVGRQESEADVILNRNPKKKSDSTHRKVYYLPIKFQSTTLINKGPCSLTEHPSVESYRKSTEKTRADGDYQKKWDNCL